MHGPSPAPGLGEGWTAAGAVSAPRIARWAQALGALRGWRRAAAAAALGAGAVLALPPVHFVPAVLAAFTGLVWLLEGIAEARRVRVAFAVGWCFGFGFFVAGLYWIAHALLVDAATFGWMIPFAVGGLSAGLAVFPGAAAAAWAAAGMKGAAGVLVLAVAWTAAEWLRGHLLTGFPWNAVGTVWAETASVMQVAAAAGVWGLGLLTVAIAAMPSTLARPAAGLRRWGPSIGAAAVLAAMAGGGLARLPQGPAPSVPDIRLRLVQPDIPQSLKWDPAEREKNLLRTMTLTRAPGFETRTHVIWPETASPFALDNASLRQAIGALAPAGGLVLTGAPRVSREGGALRVWNSLQAVDGSGEIVGTYDKFHLVPFGEYVPLREIVPIPKVTAGSVDFSAGPGPQTLHLPGLPPASPLICYEVIFPAAVSDPRDRPGWLLNVTNDAWFGLSSGPYQHFAAARFRSVEEGLPLVRAANNGISAVVDGYGRVAARLGLGRMGVVDADLPAALAPTPYARWGDAIPLALGFVALGGAFAMRRRAN